MPQADSSVGRQKWQTNSHPFFLASSWSGEIEPGIFHGPFFNFWLIIELLLLLHNLIEDKIPFSSLLL